MKWLICEEDRRSTSLMVD